MTPSWDKARAVVECLRNNGHSAYFAGGVVRDFLLASAESADIDVATSATPEEIAAAFPRSYDVGAAFGVVNVVLDGAVFEVATYRSEGDYSDGRHPDEVAYSDTPEVDALRRDFTINAMFLDPVSGEVLDTVGGRRDLERGIVRTVGDASERISEDYLRITRAVRFANRFSFRMDPELERAIRGNVEGLRSLSAERIRDELTKIFLGPRPGRALWKMAELGILEVILPEIDVMRGVPQPKKYHPEGDVFTHTALMLDMLANPKVESAWAALLHDVGKPDTLQVGDDGIERFHCHANVGAEIAENIMRRLKFPNKIREAVVTAVKGHMRVASAIEMRPAKLKRFLAEPTFPLELELHRVDCRASHAKMDIYVFLLDTIAGMENEVELPPPPLNGREIIALGVPEGPEVGKILRKLVDMRLEGGISTKDEALKAARRLATNHHEI
jgi:poly(A) polymerase